MRIRNIIATAATLAALSTTAGVLSATSRTSSIGSAGNAQQTHLTHGQHNAHSQLLSARVAYTAEANYTDPMLSEDRYVNGAWTTPQRPTSLPLTAGRCGKPSSQLCNQP